LSAGKGIGGIGFFKGVKNADYFLHTLLLLSSSVLAAGASRAILRPRRY
jgi:hypothetical protein